MISIRRAVKSFAGLERAKDFTREIAEAALLLENGGD
jgi:hypothetical protein